MKRPLRPPGPPPHTDFILGLDLGQSQDYTALAILERLWGPDPKDRGQEETHYHLRHLKRWQLKTSYPEIVAEVVKLVETPPLAHPFLAIDQTGVGVAVVDLFRQAQPKAALRPVLITAGHEITCEGAWHVPKKELVSAVQVLLQTRRIQFAKMPERELLVKELLNFKVKITIPGNETFEAWRERDHDDLVLAVAMAAWVAENVANTYVAPEPIDEGPRGLMALLIRMREPGISDAMRRRFNR